MTSTASRRPTRETIPAHVQRDVKLWDDCYYCQVPWPSEIDHAIPVGQGGASVRGNLVHACSRCNSQKSGKTPAQWKAWRLAHCLSWPPVRCDLIWFDLFFQLNEQDQQALHDAVCAGYLPVITLTREIHDRYYDERPNSPADDLRALAAIAQQYQAEMA